MAHFVAAILRNVADLIETHAIPPPSNHVALNLPDSILASIPDPSLLNPDHDSAILIDLESINSSPPNPRKRPAEAIPRQLDISSRLRSSAPQKKGSHKIASEDNKSRSTGNKERYATTTTRSDILRTCPFIFEQPKDEWRDLSKSQHDALMNLGPFATERMKYMKQVAILQQASDGLQVTVVRDLKIPHGLTLLGPTCDPLRQNRRAN